MSRRPPGVFRDPKGTWGYVFTSSHPRPDGGRRQVRRRGFPTMGDANDALDQARRDDTPGTAGTVGAVLEQFVRLKRLSGRAPTTLAQYQWAADQVRTRWGMWPAERLTAEHLDAAYLEMLAGGKRAHRRGEGSKATDRPMSARSVEVVHKTVKAAFQLAVDKGQVVRNPAALATPPAVVDQRHTWWTPEQVGRFLAFAAEHSDLPAGLVDVLADTGGRRGEVLGLRWSDIDLEAATATITRQLVGHPDDGRLAYRSTKRPRSKATVGLHPDTVAALRRQRVAQSEHRLKMGAGWPGAGTVHADLVFTWPDGRAIRPGTLTRIIARLSVAASLPRLTPHGLRHSFATAALRARVPVEVVAARLGNTPRVVQEVYSHVIPADDQAAAQLVGDLYRARGQGSGG
jgi:integrase